MHPCTHVAQAALHDGTLHALPSTVSRLLVHTRDTLTLPSLQDHILPYMADERHAGDTLFLVCEEDFRLFARDSVCNPAALNQLATAAYAASSTAWKARHPLPCFEEPAEPVAAGPEELFTWRHDPYITPPMLRQRLFGPPASGTDNWRKLFGGLFEPISKPSKEEIEHYGMSVYLEDIVQICTKADRKNLGDLVWLSYDAADKKGQRHKVQHAATLIAVSHAGAKKLKDLVDAGKLGGNQHFDISLINYLAEHGDQFGASYVYPCIGHYQSHFSQSSDTEGWREATWSQKWVQEGTRERHVERGEVRWLMGWQGKKGAGRWLCEIPLPHHEEDLQWYTASSAPPGWAENQRRKHERAAAEPQSKSRPSRPPRAVNQFCWDLTATERADFAQPLSKRQKREQRRRLSDYSFRIFAGPNDPVATVRR